MLSRFLVHKRAVNFIVDSDFDHFSQYERIIKFVRQTFKELKPTDRFGVRMLGDQKFNIELETKWCNERFKHRLLHSLENSIEDMITHRRVIDIDTALRASIHDMEAIITSDFQYHGHNF